MDETKRHLIDRLNLLAASPSPGRFAVLFFDHDYEAMPGVTGLLPANKANIDTAIKWIESVHPRGGTDPVPAMTEALAMKPQLIHLLSDGAFNPMGVDDIRALNKSNTLISCISIWMDSRQLKDIADQNKASLEKGDYRHIPAPGRTRQGMFPFP